MRAARLSSLKLGLLAGLSALTLLACAEPEPVELPPEDRGTPPFRSKLKDVAFNEAVQRETEREAEREAGREGTRSYLRRELGEGYLTAERIHTTALSGTPLRRTTISPDGTRVGYLKGSESDPDQLDLWAIDVETGEESLLVSSLDLLGAPEVLSEEERNRRERAREYGRGIIDYSWVDADTLLFPLGGDVYLYDLSEGEARQVTATEGFESDIKLSASNSRVAYVRDDELFVTDLDTGLERQLTRGATDTVRNAVASFVVQEELDRDTGYWLDPSERRVAFTRIDESPIALTNRTDMGPDGLRTVAQRYPFAGTPNATVELLVVPLQAQRGRVVPVRADIGDDPDIYLTRVAWSPDGERLYAGVLSRDHTRHTVYAIDPASGESEVFYEETSPTWLNIRSDFEPTEDGFRMVSERDGIRRYYDVTAEGARALTPDGLTVNSVACEADDALYVTGWDTDPLQRHIFAVTTPDTPEDAPQDAIETPSPVATQISAGEGRHSATFAADCSRYIGRFSSPTQPPQTATFSNTGERLAWLNENRLDTAHPYGPYRATQVLPEYGTLAAADGTELHYELYKPLDLRDGERRASVTIVYGGPGVQRVHKGWERRELAQLLANHGFVVFKLDGRGSGNRGKAFEDHLHRAMGRIEVEDQRAGAEWLASQAFIDPQRMGVYGWSYGGYMTLHMLGQTDLYAAGVSGAPVTDWALYDTAYTERYLGDPNPGTPNYTEGAYETGSVLSHVEGLTEPLLVIHGMADDNVVFQHSVKLADAMIEAGRTNMVLKPYPSEKHGFRAQSARIHRDASIADFFLDHLDRAGGSGR